LFKFLASLQVYDIWYRNKQWSFSAFPKNNIKYWVLKQYELQIKSVWEAK